MLRNKNCTSFSHKRILFDIAEIVVDRVITENDDEIELENIKRQAEKAGDATVTKYQVKGYIKLKIVCIRKVIMPN